MDKYTYVYFHPSSSLYQNKFFNIRKERWPLTKRLFRYNLGHFLSAMLTLNTITKTSIDQLRETSMYPHLIKIKSKIKHIPQEMNYEEKVILSIYIISIFCYIVLFLYKLL